MSSDRSTDGRRRRCGRGCGSVGVGGAKRAKTSRQCVTESLLHTWFSLLVFPHLLHVSLHIKHKHFSMNINWFLKITSTLLCVCVSIIFDQCFFSTPAPSAAQDRTKRRSIAELKSCHLIESGKTTTWRAHVWHSANTQQSTWHQFLFLFTMGAVGDTAEWNNLSKLYETERERNKMIFQKSLDAASPAVFIVIEQHWPKIKPCTSYRLFTKSICQITFSVVPIFLLLWFFFHRV